jgi:tRNA dimethylallyltransferase
MPGMPEAFFLVGPTASGKSAVAQYIAEQEGQLIVSADSMNLYRGMDIGTAKPSNAERAAVDYAGIDLADPSEKFSVAAYLNSVRPAFESGRETIVAGGTGLYIKCLTEGFDNVPPENEELRAELEALEVEELVCRARQDAPDLYEQLTEDDRRNPRRLIRILEREFPSDGKWNSRPRPLLVGLHVARTELHKRTGQRVNRMYAEGLLDEARSLMDLDLSATALQAIGYAEAFAVLRSEMTLEEAKEKTVIRTRQLAKRQMTWFRNQLNVSWIDTAQFPGMAEIADAVKCEWQKLGATPIVFD